MDFRDRLCQHLNLVEDIHEGSVVCSLCGLVLSPLFIDQISHGSNCSNDRLSTENFNLSEIKNFLDRIHISSCFAPKINAHLNKNYTIKSRHALVYSIFKILNEMNIPISMNEISQASNVNKKNLHQAQLHNDVVNIDFSDIVEKYAKLLNLNFETLTLIKERIRNSPKSGHNPNSVLASTIYQVCKLLKHRISMKKIGQVTKVSCVSIQRYNKFCTFKNDSS